MLKTIFIGIAALIFIGLCVGTWYQQDYCSELQNSEQRQYLEPPKDAISHPPQSKNQTTQGRLISIGARSKSKMNSSLINQEYSNYSAETLKQTKTWKEAFICEAKVTDVALAWFTFFLAIATIGLIITSIRQEKMSRTHERAYIICGGLFGVPIIIPQPPEQIYSPKATNFKGPWCMMIFNHGRTPGFITKIQWGVWQKHEFREDIPVSQIIKENQIPNRIITTTIQDVFPPTGANPLRYRYVSCKERKVGEVFFGRIDYEDVFGDHHHSTFSFLFGIEHTDTIGKAFTRDWS